MKSNRLVSASIIWFALLIGGCGIAWLVTSHENEYEWKHVCGSLFLMAIAGWAGTVIVIILPTLWHGGLKGLNDISRAAQGKLDEQPTKSDKESPNS